MIFSFIKVVEEQLASNQISCAFFQFDSNKETDSARALIQKAFPEQSMFTISDRDRRVLALTTWKD